jgi:hypothetical protein
VVVAIIVAAVVVRPASATAHGARADADAAGAQPAYAEGV